MKNYGKPVEINYNPNQFYIPDHPYRILITGGSGSGKSNVLRNLMKHQQADIDKIYLNLKDRSESKSKLPIKRRNKLWIRKIKHQKTSIYYSQTTDNVYENLEGCNPTHKKQLIVFDDSVWWYHSRYES